MDVEFSGSRKENSTVSSNNRTHDESSTGIKIRKGKPGLLHILKHIC